MKDFNRRHVIHEHNAHYRHAVSPPNLAHLLLPLPDPEKKNKRILIAIGTLLLPITLIGALLGYVRGYKRFMRYFDQQPALINIPPIVRFAMASGAVAIWLALFLAFGLVWAGYEYLDIPPSFTVSYLVANLAISLIVMYFFKKWRDGIALQQSAKRQFGSASFAKDYELDKYDKKKGIYIGGGYSFDDKGHILTVAGTRGGKGTSLIIPNLLGISDYQGSWVVIDPKGENAAITANFQRSSGRNVVMLNPWGLLEDHVGTANCYNPLDLLADKTSIHLVDDAQMIAEMLVPIKQNDKNAFFTDNARAIVSGLILYIAVSQEDDDRSLFTLWKWVRMPEAQWQRIIGEMRDSEDEVNGEIIRNAGNEIVKLTLAGEETFGSIISTVLQCTDFLKSPSLRKSMQSGFDPYSLADGNTALYIIIPADKLQSHYRWLRLIVTTTLRAIIRKPNNRVTFLLDEFAALGYLPEIETALSTYAGYEVTVWPILQSLIQLQNLYDKNWESFTANCTIRQYFSVNDNFTADYVSKAMGQTSNQVGEDGKLNERRLVTPDELRRSSGKNIFAFIESNPVTYFPKRPYYEMLELKDRADKNPYI